MSFPEGQWIWKDGQLIPWHDAQVHVLSLAVQFGSSVFEGMRCYATPDGPAIFRLGDHLRRLEDSCRIYRMDLPWTREQLALACAQTVERNGFDECYVRPMVLRGYGAAGMYPAGSPIETYICAWPWGTYLGDGALEAGVDVCVSTWSRPAPNTYPALAKSAGHYNNAQLIKMEAVANGYIEAIALAPDGMVSEGSGQNVFLVRDGALITPPAEGTLLLGVTRHSVLRIAQELGLDVHEQPVPREMLYTADELFFTGTAAEVTPVRSVDRITVGDGRMGPVTKAVQQRFMEIVHGHAPAPDPAWLAYVRRMAPTVAA